MAHQTRRSEFNYFLSFSSKSIYWYFPTIVLMFCLSLFLSHLFTLGAGVSHLLDLLVIFSLLNSSGKTPLSSNNRSSTASKSSQTKRHFNKLRKARPSGQQSNKLLLTSSSGITAEASRESNQKKFFCFINFDRLVNRFNWITPASVNRKRHSPHPAPADAV